jgi:hypothetical protein
MDIRQNLYFAALLGGRECLRNQGKDQEYQFSVCPRGGSSSLPQFLLNK